MHAMRVFVNVHGTKVDSSEYLLRVHTCILHSVLAQITVSASSVKICIYRTSLHFETTVCTVIEHRNIAIGVSSFSHWKKWLALRASRLKKNKNTNLIS